MLPKSALLFLITLPVVLLQCNTKQQAPKTVDLYVPDDLEATLWAETPMFYNPTNMDVDYRGRIWITEAVNYRNYNNDSTKFLHHTKGDRVIILEDTNHDGKADSSKVFVEDEDLLSPVGIAVIGNKVVVSCSPNLIVYTDENGDDIPDKKEILLTGFGGKDHDHSLHAVCAGPDGKWYFNVGNAGPHIVKDKNGWTLRAGSIYEGGSPYNTENKGNLKSDDGRVYVGGLCLRLNSNGTGLKVMGYNFRNSYESITDSYGNLWQNDNDDQVVTCRTTWLMEGGNAGYFSNDGTRYWQADQRPGQDIFAAHWHQDDPGIMPAGDRSGAGAPTGITVNESDALGMQYVGMLLSADAGRNTIFGYHPSLKASGYNLGERSNFITSLKEDNAGYVWNDSAQNESKEKWFRPSDVTIGTDGAIYVCDWYDPVVGGHQMKDTKGFGRIYRIALKNKKLLPPVIDTNTLQGQLTAFKSGAVNVRNIGFQKLLQKGNAVIPSIQPLLNDANPYIRGRAVWLLAQLPGGKTAVEHLLRNKDVQLRTVAYKALRATTNDILPYARQMVADPSPFVRREVAASLKDLPYGQTKPLLLQLIKSYDGNDRWYLETVGAALEGHEADIYPDIVQLLAQNIPSTQWTPAMTAFAWRLHPPQAIPALTARAGAPSLSPKERQDAMTALAFINTKVAVDSMWALAKCRLPDVAGSAAYWLSFRQSNDWYALTDWSKIKFNTAYERKLAQMKVKEQTILDEHQSSDERKWRVQEMAADSVGGQLLIGLAANHKLPEKVMPYVEATIFNNPSSVVRVQAGNYFKRPGVGKVYSIANIEKLTADAGRGKTVFTARCATCHKGGNEGNTLGPDLTGIAKKFDKTELLDNIINPGAAIVFGYEPYLITTKNGESLYGFLLSENKQNVVIKDISGQQHSIAVKNITSKQKQQQSLMPDPLNNGLTEQNLADVVAYLSSLQKTARRN